MAVTMGALLGVGVAQTVLALAMIVAGAMSIVGCKNMFHVSWGVFPGAALFGVGIANAFSGCVACPSRGLLAVGIFNFLMVFVAIVAMITGGIGIRCEMDGQETYKVEDGSCSSFAKEITCYGNGTIPYDADFDDTRLMALIYHSVVLGAGVLLLLLAIAATVIAVRGRRSGQKKSQKQQQLQVSIVGGQTPTTVIAGGSLRTPASGGSGVQQMIAADDGGDSGRVNIQNANEVNVSVGGGGGGGGEWEPRSGRSQRTMSDASRSQSSRSQGSQSMGSQSQGSRSQSQSGSRSSKSQSLSSSSRR